MSVAAALGDLARSFSRHLQAVNRSERTCATKSFEDVRDQAIIRLLPDTGMRHYSGCHKGSDSRNRHGRLDELVDWTNDQRACRSSSG